MREQAGAHHLLEHKSSRKTRRLATDQVLETMTSSASSVCWASETQLEENSREWHVLSVLSAPRRSVVPYSSRPPATVASARACTKWAKEQVSLLRLLLPRPQDPRRVTFVVCGSSASTLLPAPGPDLQPPYPGPEPGRRPGRPSYAWPSWP